VALRRHPDVAWQRIGEEAVLMSLAPEGRVIGLNPAGSLLWSMLEERDEDGLVAAVVERFAIDDARAREDVRGFLAFLRERGLAVEG
jgi:hypothetical protein